MTDIKQIRYYYVDEAGDLTFFDKRGSLMLGKEGVSNTFMVGILQLDDPEVAKEKLEKLRQEILSDPEFLKIPSVMKKTRFMFHAKNDHQKVREKVFTILPSLGAKVQVAIKRKSELAKQYRQNYENKDIKMKEGDIYDKLVITIFKNMLHQADENRIVFARLGTSERREALALAIRKAKDKFEKKWKKGHDKPTIIDVKRSSDEIGLQIIDYYLWALQRLYEKEEDCYFIELQQNYSLIIDLDDKRGGWSGAWYSRKNPLTLQKIKPLVS